MGFFSWLFGKKEKSEYYEALNEMERNTSDDEVLRKKRYQDFRKKREAEMKDFTLLNQTSKKPTEQMRSSMYPSSSPDDGFGTSMAVAAATNSTMLGYAAGGNLAGAMLGDAMVPDPSPEPSSSHCDNSSSYDSGSSSCDSGSSSDSGGSFGGD